MESALVTSSRVSKQSHSVAHKPFKAPPETDPQHPYLIPTVIPPDPNRSNNLFWFVLHAFSPDSSLYLFLYYSVIHA